MEHVELSGGAFLTRITACHVTTYYHVSRRRRLDSLTLRAAPC
jgi:hypothetical protein